MKKLILNLAMVVTMLCSLALTAGATDISDFKFTLLDDGTIRVGEYTGTDTKVTVPNEFNGRPVTSMRYTFKGHNDLKSVTLPDTLTEIGYGSFYRCFDLTSITIPDSVTYIAAEAFCSSGLKNIVFPEGLETIGMGAFEGTELTSVTLPDSVTDIQTGFGRCSSLEEITLGDGLTSLHILAFEDCFNLKKVTLSENFTDCDPSAFSRCESLTTLEQAGKNTYTKDGYFVIDGCLTGFLSDENQGTFTSPSDITSIGKNCFNMTSFREIILSKGLISIDSDAFAIQRDLKKVTLPQGLTTIGDYAFNECSSLTSVHIPDSVTTIGDCAFRKCTQLYDFSMGKGVETIGASAFAGCSLIPEIALPDTLTSIGDRAFSDMSFLFSVTIPASVDKINGGIFNGSSLTDVCFEGKQARWVEVYSPVYNAPTNISFTFLGEDVPKVEEPAAPIPVTAILSNTKMQVNGVPVAVEAYMIADNNYIKLRDLATMVNNTSKNFEVTWNQAQGRIEMTSNTSYTPVGGEMSLGGTASVTAILNQNPILLNGTQVQLTAYTIKDNNYFKLRDVMKLFDIYVGYDDATRTAILDTSIGYTE